MLSRKGVGAAAVLLLLSWGSASTSHAQRCGIRLAATACDTNTGTLDLCAGVGQVCCGGICGNQQAECWPSGDCCLDPGVECGAPTGTPEPRTCPDGSTPRDRYPKEQGTPYSLADPPCPAGLQYCYGGQNYSSSHACISTEAGCANSGSGSNTVSACPLGTYLTLNSRQGQSCCGLTVGAKPDRCGEASRILPLGTRVVAGCAPNQFCSGGVCASPDDVCYYTLCGDADMGCGRTEPGCPTGWKSCHAGCIPADAVCCDNDRFCRAGTVCERPDAPIANAISGDTFCCEPGSTVKGAAGAGGGAASKSGCAITAGPADDVAWLVVLLAIVGLRRARARASVLVLVLSVGAGCKPDEDSRLDHGVGEVFDLAGDQAAPIACVEGQQTNPDHCGRCGHSCRGGTCVQGQCERVKIASGVRFETQQTIALQDGYIYFVPLDGTLGRVNLATGQVDTLSPGPYGAFLEVAGDRLFTRDSGPSVVSLPVSGGVPTEVLSAAELSSTDAVDVVGTEIYWLSGGSTLNHRPVTGGTTESISISPASTYYRGLIVDGTNAYVTRFSTFFRVSLATGQATELGGFSGDGPVQLRHDELNLYGLLRGDSNLAIVNKSVPATPGQVSVPAMVYINGFAGIGGQLYYSAGIQLLQPGPVRVYSGRSPIGCLLVDADFVYFTQYDSAADTHDLYKVPR